ncbi:MAG TPA: isopentenyl phosphate kinase [Bellilinea sp.]|nr:isopentenyl phosphate kinase [Bellilinea sp.]
MIQFLKLGGSLLTDKSTEKKVRHRRLARLAAEIAEGIKRTPETHWVLGHGSGSFGHHTAARFGTQKGVRTTEEWAGFVEVWRDARELNQIVIHALTKVGIPVIHFPASAFIISNDRTPEFCYSDSIRHAITHKLVPLVAGDVIFDREIGGTIFSTEEIFAAIGEKITPDKILLCGLDEGVYADFPRNKQLIQSLNSNEITKLNTHGSQNVDVTGGMRTKVDSMAKFTEKHPQTTVQIFSGIRKGALLNVMLGEHLGTVIQGKERQ